LRTDPKAFVNNDCVGCGLCGEIAHAAILCPSFYRADIVSNPNAIDRWLRRMRGAVIARLWSPEARRIGGGLAGAILEPEASSRRAA
jgi:indolepyruvate ferredoxin oxidoreductase alpha subunit